MVRAREEKCRSTTRAPGDTAKPVTPRRLLPATRFSDVRTAATDITASDLSGRYHAVSGSIRITGSVSSLDVETMSGNLDVQASTPWLRARTGQGRLLIRGAPQDVDASTVGGTLDIATSTILRGRFASVTGDIRYAATPAPGALARLLQSRRHDRLPASPRRLRQSSTIHP